jgi:hypothetical protein
MKDMILPFDSGDLLIASIAPLISNPSPRPAPRPAKPIANPAATAAAAAPSNDRILNETINA